MKKKSRMILSTVLATSLFGHITVAGQPQYLFPRVAPEIVVHEPAPGMKTAGSQTLHAQPYAYGWFGVQPRRHWTRHFGYYRNYTEWSAK